MRELPRDFSDRTLAKLTPVHSANAGRRHRRIDCLQLVLLALAAASGLFDVDI
jgi:hypothetical protein